MEPIVATEPRQTDKNYEVVQPKPIIIGPENLIIPECCRNGDPKCPHVPKKQRQTKRNIGL